MRMRARGCMCAMYIYIIVTLLLSSSRGRKPFSVNRLRGNKFYYLPVTCVTFHFCGFMLDLCMARALIHSCACHNLSATLLTSLGPHLPCVSKLSPDPTIGRRSDGVTRCASQAGTWARIILSFPPSDVIQPRSSDATSGARQCLSLLALCAQSNERLKSQEDRRKGLACRN